MDRMTPPPSRRRALMATLFAAQVSASTGFTMSLAVGSIMAAAITGSNTWSGLPVALGALGGALASWPLARLMGRVGRRPGLALGYAIAVGGAALGMLAVVHQSFALFLVGMALFGTANTSNLLARYAAADISSGPQRGRAMGLIVWGSTVGSIIGPNLMDPAVRVGATIGVAAVASPFLISLAGYGLAAVLVQVWLRPDPLTIAREREQPGPSRSSP
jgi:MFS family permease